jgi:hypothetical protein
MCSDELIGTFRDRTTYSTLSVDVVPRLLLRAIYAAAAVMIGFDWIVDLF